MNRRAFLASLLATAVLDPERLLWVKTKTIFIPKPAAFDPKCYITHTEITRRCLEILRENLIVGGEIMRQYDQPFILAQRDYNAHQSAVMDPILLPPPKDSPFAY